jgi:hypothetical protein
MQISAKPRKTPIMPTANIHKPLGSLFYFIFAGTQPKDKAQWGF